MDDVVMDRRKAIEEELVRGREFAHQLRQVINGDDESAATHLARNVFTSFANTLFLFNKYPTYRSLHHPSQHHTPKLGRGSYNRKRTIETWNKVSENQTDQDDHQWRKYGQKQIQNAKYSRNYYRCTHKYEQGCQATKHVQKVREEPPLYSITYYGKHTCTNQLSPSEMILHEETSTPGSSILLSFDNSFPNPTNPFLSSSCFNPSTSSSVKEECNENDIVNKDPSSSYSTEPTLEDNWFTRHATAVSSTLESEQSDFWDVMMSGFVYGSDDDDFLLMDFDHN